MKVTYNAITLTLDDRVKKFFGILPREKAAEIKTVRMVKRDSKERSVSKSPTKVDKDGKIVDRGEEDGEEDEGVRETPPPPPLPRGNNQVDELKDHCGTVTLQLAFQMN